MNEESGRAVPVGGVALVLRRPRSRGGGGVGARLLGVDETPAVSYGELVLLRGLLRVGRGSKRPSDEHGQSGDKSGTGPDQFAAGSLR